MMKETVFVVLIAKDELTDNVELHKVAHLGLGAHLALVHAGVTRLHVLHLHIQQNVID